MNSNKPKVVVIPTDNPDDDFSIMFPAYVYDFLQSKFGDVRHWATQQQDLILSGQMQFAPGWVRQIRQKHNASQREIGDLIRLYAKTLLLDEEERKDKLVCAK
jgi:hypothetical protein